jgi:hypothetical protein
MINFDNKWMVPFASEGGIAIEGKVNGMKKYVCVLANSMVTRNADNEFEMNENQLLAYP